MIPKAWTPAPLGVMGLYFILYLLSRRQRGRERAAETRRRVDDAEQERAQIAWLYALYEAPSVEERNP